MTAQDDKFSYRSLQHPKSVTIIVSSVGRSGSTLIGELLKTKEDSIFFFEPDFYIENTDCYKISNCVTEYLSSVLTCSYDQEFEDWLKNKLIFFNYFHQEVGECKKYKAEQRCRAEIDVRSLCTYTKYTVMKLIRVQLGYMETLLRDERLNVKILYLFRDPRGSGNSIRKFGWDSSPCTICSRMKDDLISFDYFKSNYPKQVYKMSYEEFCLNPVKQTTNLFEFAFNDNVLSAETQKFLDTHTKVSKSGPLNTERKSEEQYQKWRFEISKQYLSKIESFPICVDVLNTIGHTVFKSIENAKNTSIPLFKSSK